MFPEAVAEGQRKLDSLFFELPEDLEIQLFTECLEVPVIRRRIPIEEPNAERLRAKIVEENARRKIRIHPFMVFKFTPYYRHSLFYLLTGSIQRDVNLGTPANVRPACDVLDVAAGQLVVRKRHQVSCEQTNLGGS